MARSAVSDEEIQLRKRARRRLIGAIALAVLVVAALPMILDGEPPQRTQQIEVRIAPPKPPPDERNPTPSPASQASPPQPPGAEADRAAAAAGPAAGSPEAAPEAPAAERARAPDTSGTGNEAYAVAVIATASPAKAAQMKQALQRLKFPVYTQKTPDGDKTRVRVGPFASRLAAEQARQRLVRQGYDPGKVVRKGE